MKEHSESFIPRARNDNLVVKDLSDETLVYDTQRSLAHILNHVSSRVWRLSDGRKTIPQIAEALARETDIPVRPEVVELAFDQLAKNHLLANAPLLQGLSRRDLLVRLAPARPLRCRLLLHLSRRKPHRPLLVFPPALPAPRRLNAVQEFAT